MNRALFSQNLAPSPLLRHVSSEGLPAAVFDFETGFATHGWHVQRNSRAAHWTTSGLVTVDPNRPRLVTGPDGDRYLLLEQASRNRHDPANNTVVDMTSVTPISLDGFEAQRLVDDGGGYYQFDGIDIADLLAGDVLTYSVIVDQGTAPSFEFWIGVGTTGSARVRYAFDFASQSASLTGNPDLVAHAAQMSSLGGGRFRCEVTVPLVTSEPDELARIAAVDGVLDVGLFQVETGTQASTPLPDGVVLRQAETLAFSVPDGNYTLRTTYADASQIDTPVSLIGGQVSPMPPFGSIKSCALFTA